MKKLKAEFNMSILFIAHDLSVIRVVIFIPGVNILKIFAKKLNQNGKRLPKGTS